MTVYPVSSSKPRDAGDPARGKDGRELGRGRRLFWGLGLGTMALLVAAGPLAAGQSSLVDAMRAMMDAMGLRHGGNPVERPGFGGHEPWSGNSGNYRDADRAPGFGQSVVPIGARLQGIWLGQRGEQLVIKGGMFRLEGEDGRLAEGLVRARGERLAFYSPHLGRSWVFAFAEHQGRMALRDEEGDVFLFRRKDLGTFQGGAPWW